jgi:hypothetical protein
MLKMQRFELSSNDTTKLLTQELLLIVRQTSYNPISQQTQEKGEKVIFIKDKPLSCAFHLISMMTILLTSTWNAFLDCICLVNSCEMLSHTHYEESLSLDISSHIHVHIKGVKLQVYDLY